MNLEKNEIIQQLQARIKELEDILQRNSDSSFNVVQYFANRKL